MLLFFNSNFILWNDVPEPWQISFQDSATNIMEGIDKLNGSVYYYETTLLVITGWILISILSKFTKNELRYKYHNHGTLIEVIWTCTPAFILMAISFPSFKLLYLMDEIIDSQITIKVNGFLLGGHILYILNKKKDTNKELVDKKYLLNIGEKNIIINKNLFFNTFNFFNIPNIRANKRIGPHNKDVISVIVGSLLGDCYGNKKSREGIRFVYKQSIIHKEYLFWLYNFFYLRGYCSNLEPRMYIRKLKINNQIKEYYGYEFNTFTFRSLNKIYKIFYNNSKKRINFSLEDYLDSLALAIWIMDDGGWTKYGVRIATNSFTLIEVKYLVSILKTKFDLNCTIQKIKTIDQYSIYIKAESMNNLRKLILPYMHKSMYYKLGL
jgi:LAGLIDADG DNA endonuclease family/Cytochrome C oxidase subunit II, transmembrane domain